MQANYFKDDYIPQIVKVGKITCWLGALIVFLPALVVTYGYGIVPEKTALVAALIAQLSVNAVWWFIEPVSFFPILGIPGTYIAFLSGNIGNLRIPCAAAALKATETEVGSDESSVISTIGVSASVFVNIILLVVGVFLGQVILDNIDQSVRDALGYLLPALFGAVFAQFAIDDIKNGVVAMLLGVVSLTLYSKGMFNWIPLDPYIVNILVPIFGTMAFAKFTYKEAPEEASAE